MIEPPPIKFSKWVRWKERGSLRALDGASMGVYLWAHFHRTKKAQSSPYPDLSRDLIYVGESNDINARLLEPRGGQHHRLEHYRRIYLADSELALLHVSVFHIEPFRRDSHCHAIRAFTRFVESHVQWEYTRRYGQRPALDYKTGKEPWLLPGGREAFPGWCCEVRNNAV
jgi:hypothetical protein